MTTTPPPTEQPSSGGERPPAEPYPEGRALAEKVVDKALGAGVGVPALLMLEMTRPLNVVMSSMLMVFSPLITTLFPVRGYDEFCLMLGERGNVEAMIERLEAGLEREDEARRQAKERRRKTPGETTAAGDADEEKGH
jgi:hypothetical protein